MPPLRVQFSIQEVKTFNDFFFRSLPLVLRWVFFHFYLRKLKALLAKIDLSPVHSLFLPFFHLLVVIYWFAIVFYTRPLTDLRCLAEKRVKKMIRP